MIHTVHLDDKYVNIRNILHEILSQEQGVSFGQSFNTSNFQNEKYMNSKDFWEEADKRIIKICKQYGVFQ